MPGEPKRHAGHEADSRRALTRLIVDQELVRIFRHLEKLEAEGLEKQPKKLQQ